MVPIVTILPELPEPGLPPSLMDTPLFASPWNTAIPADNHKQNESDVSPRPGLAQLAPPLNLNNLNGSVRSGPISLPLVSCSSACRARYAGRARFECHLTKVHGKPESTH